MKRQDVEQTIQISTPRSDVRLCRSGFCPGLFDIGAEPVGNKPEEMAKQIKDETEKFAGLVKAGKVTID